MHTADVSALDTVPYRPRAHALQADAPESALYEPTAQEAQRSDEPRAAEAPYVPAAQAVHTSEVHATTTSLYKPAGHTTQVPFDW